MKEWLKKQILKKDLVRVFETAGLYREYNGGANKKIKIFPKIHDISYTDNEVRYVFTLPSGLDPEQIHKKWYCFQQVLGMNIKIEGDVKRFTLTIFQKQKRLESFKYKYKDIKPLLIPYRLPILAGKDEEGNMVVYDMTEEPHLLVAGETGAGKSSVVRGILCTLIQYLKPEQLHLYLADLKMQEFHIFRRVAHVKEICTDEPELLVILNKLIAEVKRRQKLTVAADVENVWEYNEIKKEKLPYILLCIDEFAEVQENAEIRRLVERISSVGRSAAVFLMNSTQRPDAEAVPGKLKINLTVRMGLKVPDKTNSNIIGTPGAENIEQKGQMILRLKGLTKIQCPHLELKDAKVILDAYKVDLPVVEPQQEEPIFGVLDDEE